MSVNAPGTALFYALLPFDRLDRIARQRGEIVSVCLSCRVAYDVKDPKGGTPGRSDGLCGPCFQRDYADA